METYSHRPTPTFDEEAALWQRGFTAVAGIDEVGRGPLAGPVMAAAVIVPRGAIREGWLEEVRDSKALRPAQRERLCSQVKGWAAATGLGLVDAAAIDSQGIASATRLAMARAVSQLQSAPDYLLIDALHLPRLQLPQKNLIKGDALCISIAAASIVAKVARDALMEEMDGRYPGYGFARHKGYGTGEHLAALARLGPCPIHRRSFAPLRQRLDA